MRMQKKRENKGKREVGVSLDRDQSALQPQLWLSPLVRSRGTNTGTRGADVCPLLPQMDRGEFQQDSVLKQLEVLKEEEKEFQNLKVSPGTQPTPPSPPSPIPSRLPALVQPPMSLCLHAGWDAGVPPALPSTPFWGTHGVGVRVG